MTGGLGFIGSNLTLALLELGHTVTVVDDMSSARNDADDIIKNNPDAKFIRCCFADDKIISRIGRYEFDYIFHVAAIPRVSYSVEHPFETTDVNVNRTVKLIEASVGHVRRFIFSSSSSVYGGADVMPTPVSHPKSPKSPYAWQKSCIEDFIGVMCDLNPNFDAVCLRYFNVFGPGQFGGSAYATAISAWCHAIKSDLILRKDGTGEQSRDMCYVGNVVDANIKSMTTIEKFRGDRFNVACGDRVSNNDILNFLRDRFDEIKIENTPSRPGDVMHTQADITLTEEKIGYVPATRFWDGMELTLKWWGLNSD